VQTDPTNPNNIPDIIIYGNEKGTCALTDIAISGNRNVIKKVVEVILQCKYLIVEIYRMWNAKTKVIPEIVGTTGTVSKSLRHYLTNTTAMHEIKALQKQQYWSLHKFWKALI
jgi:hypothetical protein